uniref:Acetylcholinesterase n=1 Tax=Parastrongyloides trichosuri TaxID=131310 RepID=A0A0N4ZK00_PARTI
MKSTILVCTTLLIWIIITIIACFLLLIPLVKVIDTVSKDYKKIESIFNEILKLDTIINDLQLEVTELKQEDIMGDDFIALSGKLQNIEKLSNLIITEETKKLIKEALNEPDVQLIKTKLIKGQEAVQNDLKIFMENMKEMFDEMKNIDYLFYMSKEDVQKLNEYVTTLVKDLELLKTKKLKTMKSTIDKITHILNELIDIKEKYQKIISFVFVKKLLMTDPKPEIKYNNKNIDDGFIVILHSCFYFDVKTGTLDDQKALEMFIGKFNKEEIQSKFIKNHDVSIKVNQNGKDGEKIEICPPWAKKQEEYYKLFLGMIIIFLIIEVLFLLFTLLSFTGKKTVEGKGVTEFLGIPYAQPPIGELRFMKPQELNQPYCHKKFSATRPASSCPQISMIYAPSVEDTTTPTKDIIEDCLQMNIWKPNKESKEKIPVIVFFHGGIFSKGSGSLDMYNGSVLAAFAESIVITVNYRIGALGFASFYESKNVTGNMGLWDQLMSLKWINKNIENFGGDKEKVTIFGEDSGSSLVNAHIFSEESRKFFSRAILTSGYLSNIWAVKSNKKIQRNTRKLVDKVLCNKQSLSETVKCMQNKHVRVIVEKYFEMKKDSDEYFNNLFMINENDDKFFKGSLETVRSKFKPTKSLDIMIGNTNNEAGTYVVNKYLKNGCYYKFFDWKNIIIECNFTNYQYNNIFDDIISEINLGSKLEKKMKDYYSKIKNNTDKLMKIYSDIYFDCDKLQLAEKLSSVNKVNLYLYNFNFRSSASTEYSWMRTTHGIPLEYIFGLPFRHPRRYNPGKLQIEKEFSQKIMEIWGKFVLNGNPGSNWKKYTKNIKKAAIIDSDIVLEKKITKHIDQKLHAACKAFIEKK